MLWWTSVSTWARDGWPLQSCSSLSMQAGSMRLQGNCCSGTTPAARKTPLSRLDARPRSSFGAEPRRSSRQPPDISQAGQKARLRLGPFHLHHFQPLVRLQVALATKPVFHGRLKAFEGHVRPGFEHSVGHGQRVVEDRIVGEVAHGKIVDPANRAGVPGAARVDPLNGKPAREHAFNVMDARPARAPIQSRLFLPRQLCALPLLGIHAEAFVIVVALSKVLAIVFHQQHTSLHGCFRAGRKPYFAVHLRLIKMKIGTLLDIGYDRALLTSVLSRISPRQHGLLQPALAGTLILTAAIASP